MDESLNARLDAEELARQDRLRKMQPRDPDQRQMVPAPAQVPGLQVVNPELRAKAAAKEAFFAGSGSLINPGRGNDNFQHKFRMGRLKNKTYDQANAEFERLWAGSSPEIRAKYEKLSDPVNQMGPGEKAKYVPTTKPETPAEQAERQKRSRIKSYQGEAGLKAYDENVKKAAARKTYDKDGNGISDFIQRPAEAVQKPVTAPAKPTAAIGTPEEQARVAALVSQGSNFATADNGDGGMKAALAMRDGAPQLQGPPEPPPFVGPPKPNGEVPSGFVNLEAPFKDAANKFREEEAKGQKTPLASAAKALWTGVKSMGGEWGAAMTGKPSPSLSIASIDPVPVTEVKSPMGTTWKDAQGNSYPTNPNGPSAPAQATTGLAGNTVAKNPPAVAAPLAQTAPAPSARAANIAATGGDMSKLATDDRMVAQGKVNGGIPADKAPRGTYDSGRPEKPTLGPSPAGMELVGMKGGVPQYEPIASVYGDTQGKTDEQVRADYQAKASTPAMRAGADASMRQMGVAIPTAQVPGIMRGPASQPVPTGPVSRNDPKVNQDLVNQHAAALKAQDAPGATMPYGDAAQKIAEKGTEMDRIAMGANSLARSAAADEPNKIKKNRMWSPVM